MVPLFTYYRKYVMCFFGGYPCRLSRAERNLSTILTTKDALLQRKIFSRTLSCFDDAPAKRLVSQRY